MRRTSVKQYASGIAYASGAFTSEVAYTYDALGRMASRTPTNITGEQTRVLRFTDGPNLALVLNTAGQVVEREFHGAGGRSGLRQRGGDAGD